MYDMHKELNEFYEEHVRLKDEKKKLKEHRDTNLEALKDGLKKLKFPFVFDKKDQGSYAMDTINKHPEKKYDIDVAVIFEKDDLPSKPVDARKRIEDAMVEGGGDFNTPPEAKTNAVRVSYAKGYHVDLAVYRKNKDIHGNSIIEHAGADWTTRDPIDITNWFVNAVQARSPQKIYGSNVDDMQLRRTVRWLKMFSKSCNSWNMPGGLIISVLAVECYVSDINRDDISLHGTMKSIRDRLEWNKEVNNPVDITQSLTEREKDKTRIKNLSEQLDSVLDKLDDLFDLQCDCLQALKAWDSVFDHSYWKNKLGESMKNSLVAGLLGVTSSGSLIKKEGERSIPVPPTRFFGG